ncbi:hypothetical protein MCHUDSM44219_00930 [Mycolicibacterium chubuense]|uniref:Uncharacterized protein n=1 Tax=Mycolicibacterium chubuense TaxID=1800 RepID=A0A0J6WLB4_MYCCU|nr:hypothetical protein MCHUDSM44219_00930 [Mycolicibacterium chubuense]SPX99851.1 Uncharacterised protein [Mycolicibacterium chubuense]
MPEEVLAAAAICGAGAVVRTLVFAPPVGGSAVCADARRVHASRVDSSVACAGVAGFGRVDRFVVSVGRTLTATVSVAVAGSPTGFGEVSFAARTVVPPATSAPGSTARVALSARRGVGPSVSAWPLSARFVAVAREVALCRRWVVGASVDSGLSTDVRRGDRGWATDGRGVPSASLADDCEVVESEVSANATPGIEASAVPIPSATASAPIRPMYRPESLVERCPRWTDPRMFPSFISCDELQVAEYEFAEDMPSDSGGMRSARGRARCGISSLWRGLTTFATVTTCFSRSESATREHLNFPIDGNTCICKKHWLPACSESSLPATAHPIAGL